MKLEYDLLNEEGAKAIQNTMRCKRPIVLMSCVLALVGALTNFPALGAGMKTLPGHLPAAISQLSPLGVVESTNQMRLAIGLPLRDPAGLDKFLAELYDPASTNFHKYLTPEEFTTRFGPTEQDYAAVIQYARANGMEIAETSSNRLVLDVVGPAVAVESALHVKFHRYQHPREGRQFFAPDAEPSVFTGLPVADIQGLSDYFRPRPHLMKANATNLPKNGTGPSGALLGDDFRNAYAAGSTMTGAGQSVGLLQFDGYYANDIAAYASAAGGGRANIVVQTVLLDGYSGRPTSGGNPEVSLDIEMVMAMAPGLSKIVVFEAGPNGFPNDVLNSMVQNSAIKSFSSSWGWSGGPSATTDNIFKAMAAQGQSFFNASGDSCAFTSTASSANGVDNPNSDNAPSSSPYVTVVGGTTLSMSGGAFSSEKVWNWGGGAGSSGGISTAYAIPGWQAGVSMAANQGSTSHRNIPDVALTADDVAVDYGNGSSGFFGGTSCAAPLWAGFMALVNQQAANQGNSPAGFINPAVYAIGTGQNSTYSYASCFHDTATGNNFSSASPNNFSAVAGYDLCTGWGTPNGANLINALSLSGNGTVNSTNTTGGSTNTTGSSAANLSISPGSGFAFSGVAGGPFTPTSETLQITNESSFAVSWSLISTSAWLKVQTTNGTLAANAAVHVIASLTTTANTLKTGSYSTSLTFGNVAAHSVQEIPVTMLVSQPMSLSTTQGFAATGALGGPFTASSQAFILTNLSSSTTSWSLVNTSSWLSVSASSGSLTARAHVTVTVSVATTAKSLKAGAYSGNVRFNSAAGQIAVVPFSLAVIAPMIQNGGFETGTFTGWSRSGNPALTSVARVNSTYVHTGTYGADLGPTGTPGYLSQTVMTVSGQTYRLSLWLRNALGRTPNSFQVQWNGAPVYTATNFSNKNWTNLQFLVTATSASSALQLGFQGSLNETLGLDDVSLAPVANTSIKFVARKSDDFQLVWNTSAGNVYQAQYKTNLCQPDWINLGEPTPADADSLILTDTNAFQISPQRFYRLLAIPPP